MISIYFNIENFFKTSLIKEVWGLEKSDYINIINTDVFFTKNLFDGIINIEESPQQLLNKSIDLQWFIKVVNLESIEQILTDGFLNLYYGVKIIDISHINLSFLFILLFLFVFFSKKNILKITY